MGKISKHGGASVRVFDRPRTAADVLRSRGKLGPYGDGAKVESFSTDGRQHPGTGEAGEDVTATPDGTERELTAEPTPAEVRAWAKTEGINVSARGKLPAELVDEYKAAVQAQAAATAVSEPTPAVEE